MNGLVAETIPGLLAMLESGDEPGPGTVAISSTDELALLGEAERRAGLGIAAFPGDFSRRWAQLLDRLGRYRQKTVLFENESILLPLIDLYCPPGGSARLTYSRDTAIGANAQVSILGPGFGNGYRLSLTESRTIDAAGVGKRWMVNASVSAITYVDHAGNRRVRIDVNAPTGPPREQISDLDLDEDDPAVTGTFDPKFWTARRIVVLRSATVGQGYSFSSKASSESEWQVTLGDIPLLSQIGIKPIFNVRCATADAIEYSFSLPYGHDYWLYDRAGCMPLVPHVAPDGLWPPIR